MAHSDGTPPATPHLPRVARALRNQSVYLLAVLGAIIAVALLLSSLAVGLQSRRDEARTADLLLVVASAPLAPELTETVLDLARRGYAPELVLVGSGAAALRAALVEQGQPEGSMQLGPEAPSELAMLQAAAAAARGRGAATAVVVGEPVELLTLLKAVEDSGLEPFGAPVPALEPDPLAILSAGVRYWGYALFQR